MTRAMAMAWACGAMLAAAGCACGEDRAPGDDPDAGLDAGPCEGLDCPCPAGFADCDGLAENGCEQGLFDREHCGACDAACEPGQLCEASGAGPRCAAAPTDCAPGFRNCDGDLSDGCEGLDAFYPDRDGDGYGAGSATLQCAGAPVPGHTTRRGDCDDSRSGVHPGATEVCNGRDDNCVGGIDEGYAVGAACVCADGAAPGAQVCDAAGALVCSYPAEVCNGADDDCDLAIDDGFACAAGQTRGCSAIVGACTASGTETCTAGCAWGECVIEETCNRADDDCDGFVDEGPLRGGPWRSITDYEVNSNVRTDVGAGGDVGVLYGVPQPMAPWAAHVHFVRVDAEGRMRGAPVAVTDGFVAADYDLVWDGAHWLAVVAEHTGPHRGITSYRIEAGTDRVYRGFTISTDDMPDENRSPSNVRVDRIGGTASDVALAWTTAPTARAYAQRITLPRSASEIPALTGARSDFTTWRAAMGTPAVVGHAEGAAVFFVRFRFVADANVYDVLSSWIGPTGDFSPAVAALADADPKDWLDGVYEPTSGRIGLVYQRAIGDGFVGSFHAIDVRDRAIGDEHRLGSIHNVRIATAGDGLFAVATEHLRDCHLHRFRASDLTEYPRTVELDVRPFALEGIREPGDPVRYLAIDLAAWTIGGLPVMCP